MYSIAKQDRHFLTHKISNACITVNNYFTIFYFSCRCPFTPLVETNTKRNARVRFFLLIKHTEYVIVRLEVTNYKQSSIN